MDAYGQKGQGELLSARSRYGNVEKQMRQIGGEDSLLFSLTAEELKRLEQRTASGQMPAPLRVFHEGPVGANVRFRSPEDAMTAKLSIA